MAFIAEMHYGRPGEPGFRKFSCGDTTWYGLLALAQRYGWKPCGTQQFYAPYSRDPAVRETQAYRDAERLALGDSWDPALPHTGDYKPMDYMYGSTIVGPEDARGMAIALVFAHRDMRAGRLKPEPQAGPLLLVDGMTAEQALNANRGISDSCLLEFLVFVNKGPFRLNWDD